MTVSNVSTLDAYALIAQQTYLDEPPFDTGPTDPVADANGSSYIEITQIVNGPLGFQARAFFNTARNELVIAFTGTEGAGDLDAAEFLPDLVTNFGLAVAGTGPQVPTAEAFITQATTAAALAGNSNFDITYVGHSLGGFLAQAASAAHGSEGEVVVFNAPGAGGFLGLPLSGAFPEDRYTYVYSDPADWGLLGGAIHSLGDRLSDNIFVVPGAEGHAISTAAGTGISDALTDNTVLVAAAESIFTPVNEALQTLGMSSLLDFYTETFEGTSGNDILLGTSGADVLDGGTGNDTLNGGTGDDFIFGGDGNDILNGQGGADTLDGGAGNDWLNGGWGWDEMTGGSGADKFYHHGSQTGFGTEWISDFSNAENDRLVLGAGASGSASDFVVTFATTTGRGSDAVAEAFVRYAPTGQVAWVLTDGADLDHIMIQTNEGIFDLLG